MAAEETPSVATEVALLRQDFAHMSADVAEIKVDFKEFRKFFATKEELVYIKTDLEAARKSLQAQLDTWKKFALGIATAVVGAFILQLAALLNK